MWDPQNSLVRFSVQFTLNQSKKISVTPGSYQLFEWKDSLRKRSVNLIRPEIKKSSPEKLTAAVYERCCELSQRGMSTEKLNRTDVEYHSDIGVYVLEVEH